MLQWYTLRKHRINHRLFSIIIMYYNYIKYVFTGHPKIVDLLLRSGAKVDIVNSVGRTAAQLGGFVG